MLQLATKISWKTKHRSDEGSKDLATSREGTCLSEEYFGSKVKLLWKCEFGHRWHAAPSYVVQGTWCPVCARNQRLTLEQFQELASKKGGACLSVAYKNERTALYWRCACGHEWEAVPAKIKRGSWCPTCASIAKRSDWMHRRAPLQSEIRESRGIREIPSNSSSNSPAAGRRECRELALGLATQDRASQNSRRN